MFAADAHQAGLALVLRRPRAFVGRGLGFFLIDAVVGEVAVLLDGPIAVMAGHRENDPIPPVGSDHDLHRAINAMRAGGQNML